MKETKYKPNICRIVSLRNFGGVLIGRDMAEVFEEGKVYQVYKVLDTIMIEPLGEHAVDKRLTNKNGALTARVGAYLVSGVTMLTKEEYANQSKEQ